MNLMPVVGNIAMFAMRQVWKEIIHRASADLRFDRNDWIGGVFDWSNLSYPPSSKTMFYEDCIIRDPNICNGEPVIRGTRVTLRTILASLAEGQAEESILQDFPALTREHLRGVIAFAAASAEEDIPVPELPIAR